MSSATHVGVDAAVGSYPTDEQILGIDPPSPKGGFGGLVREEDAPILTGGETSRTELKTSLADAGDDAGEPFRTRELSDGDSLPAADGMPAWMQTLAGDP
jgi:hypothetical protein